VSVGDVFAYTGAMWFIVASMRRRRPVEADAPGADAAERAGSSTGPEPVEAS
jgi:hypothetical protein